MALSALLQVAGWPGRAVLLFIIFFSWLPVPRFDFNSFFFFLTTVLFSFFPFFPIYCQQPGVLACTIFFSREFSALFVLCFG